jgi:hypothetical protein
MRKHYTPPLPPIGCERCNRMIVWPIWLYIGDAEYMPVCRRCCYQIKREFTPINALYEAVELCGAIGRGVIC